VQQYEREKDPLAQKRLLNKMMLPLIASQERKNIAAYFNCFDNQENSLLFFFVSQANSVSDPDSLIPDSGPAFMAEYRSGSNQDPGF
jgi:hypothetical protein